MFAPIARLLLCGLLLGSAASVAQAQQQQAGPPAVTVVKVEQRDVTPTTTFTGKIEAIDKIDLRARVKGFLERRDFTEGDLVAKDQLLFGIEKDQFAAEVESAQGAVLGAQGALKLADLEVQRQTTLVARQATAQVQLDTATAKQAQAQGTLAQQEAALTQAQLNLSYTDIKAPFAGRIGRSNFSIGDIVGPDSGPLATLVSQDPIYVNFPIAIRQAIDVQRRARASGSDPTAVTIRLQLADGSLYSQPGAINFVDVQANSGTDTVIIRATMPNPQGQLIDSALVTVLVEAEKPVQALVVPQDAIQIDQGGRYVLVVDKDSKIAVRRITIGQEVGGLYVVDQGLAVGDAVVTQGLQRVRPGIVVKPTEVPMPAPVSMPARS